MPRDMLQSNLERLMPSRTPPLLLAAWLALSASITSAATDADLRAALIYNIARFVQWPALDSGASFNICTVGDSPTVDALAALAGKSLDGLPVAARSIRRDRDLAACHVLYIAPEDTVRMAAISSILAQNHDATLTISDAPGFLALGGMVQLIVIAERQRFSINQDLAEKANLNINAKLLQLALPRD